MKKIFYLFLFIYSLTIYNSNAQATFFNTVKIEFEKTLSTRQLVKELDPDWYERIKDRLPVSTLSYFDFIADSTASIFKPGREVATDPRNNFFGPVANKNVVYTNFKKKQSISQKPIFEETFLVEDSLLKIKWKLTPDTRTIAGFECKKAVGILNDSISLFAFYTDELMITGGPEGIQGLPGMILGLGIPRLHATWFATKVEVNNVNTSMIAPATKGKKVDRSTLIKSLDKVLKQWGTYGSKMIMTFVI
jgi:GLPGLI family protein